jgi:hypothetical protein
MNHSSVVAFSLVGMSLIGGCASTVDAPGPSEQTSASAQALTLTQCASQRDDCLTKNPLFGLFICPAQYNLCALSASNGLPAQVNSAISDAASCASSARECNGAATTGAEHAACGKTEADCVAAVVQAQLPSAVTGTGTCAKDAETCINAAEKVSDLTTCGNNLESCIVTQVQMVVPEQVGALIGDVSSCDTALNSCVAAAATPRDVTSCMQTRAMCVASSLGVTLPDVSVTGVVQCAETAGNCVFDASTPDDVMACTSTLRSCVAEAGLPTLPPMTCQQKWTTCLAKNPFNFLTCDAQLLTCQTQN